jgi:NAD(P)-dependent dehydrogenase (short-subunit alcohol dehydrogenase family)
VRVIVIGGTGTIGSAVVRALEGAHEVISASRSRERRADLADARTIAQLLERLDDIDSVVCCAANAPLVSLTGASDDEFVASITPKLLGQVRVAFHAARRLREGGSITLTSGAIPEGTSGAAGGAMVNAGLEAFVRAAAQDLGRGLRLNAVSPGWVAETMTDLGMDAAQGVPVAAVARAYVAAIEGDMCGEILRPGA